MDKTVFSVFFMLLILVSCGKTKEVNNRVRFIMDWEYDSPLSEDESFQCDEIGVYGIKVVDSVIVVNYKENWSVLSCDGKKKYADFLSIGQGPAEFVYSVPYVWSSYFNIEKDSLVAYIPNNKRGVVVEANLTDLISGGKGNLSEPIVNSALKKAWTTVVCKPTLIMVSVPNDSLTGIRKYICTGDSMSEVKATEYQDAVRVRDSNNLNLLGGLIRYNDTAGKFVETKAFLNWINIFSHNSDDLKTVCVGKKMFDLAELDEREINYDENTFYGAAAWDKGFGVICAGGLISESGPFQSEASDLLVFDWDGNPMYRTKFPFLTKAFDIDWANRRLIVHDKDSDRVLAYDATPIIKRFE